MNLDELLKKSHSFYYYKMPGFLWKIFNPLIEPLIVRLRTRSFDSQFRHFSVIRISGNSKEKEKGVGGALRVTILGSELEAAYYTKIFFDGEVQKITLENTIPFSQTLNTVQKEKGTADIIIVRAAQNHGEMLWRNGFFVIPDQITQEMRIPSDFSPIDLKFKKILKTFPVNSELAQIKIEQSTNPSDLREFYDEMYVPTVKKRFNETGFTFSFEELKVHFSHGLLLFMSKNSTRFGGTLITRQSGGLKGIVFGVKDGEEELLRKGYLPVLYYESLKYAHSQKYTKLNFGHTKPFLMDGILRFKKKLGTEITLTDMAPIIHAIYFPHGPMTQNNAAAVTLENNAVILIRKNKIASLSIFTKNDPALDSVQHAQKVALIPGINKFIIAAPHFSIEVKKAFENDKTTVLVEENDLFSLQQKVKELI